MTGGEIVKLFNSLKTQRQPLEPNYRDCYDLTFPLRGAQFTASVTAPNTIGGAKATAAKIYDSTAPDACKTLAAAWMTGLTPANSKWMGYKAEGDDSDDSEANRWLDQATSKLHGMIHSSNFDAPAFEGMQDATVVGWFALYVTEGTDAPFHFELWDLARCYVAASKRGGLIDTIYYHFSLTAEQAVREYGEKNLPERILKVIGTRPHERFQFVHAIFPRKDTQGKRRRKKDEFLPFASYQVELGSKQVVRESGYHEFPVVVPRVQKLPGSVYAVGPFQEALPDTRSLNEAKRLTLANADMAISGMWGAVDDGVLNPKTVRIGARKIIYMASKDSFFPLASGGKFDLSALVTADLQKGIRRILNADLLETNAEGAAKTATEWHYRVNLIRQQMGPMYGRMQSEYLQPLVWRCFGIALRAGWLGTPPEALQGKELRLQYISPLARAQKQEDVAAMDRYEQGLLAKAQVKPELLDNYDFDMAEKEKANLLGVPAKLIRSEKAVTKIREQRKKDMEKQQQAAAEAEAAKRQPLPKAA